MHVPLFRPFTVNDLNAVDISTPIMFSFLLTGIKQNNFTLYKWLSVFLRIKSRMASRIWAINTCFTPKHHSDSQNPQPSFLTNLCGDSVPSVVVAKSAGYFTEAQLQVMLKQASSATIRGLEHGKAFCFPFPNLLTPKARVWDGFYYQ